MLFQSICQHFAASLQGPPKQHDRHYRGTRPQQYHRQRGIQVTGKSIHSSTTYQDHCQGGKVPSAWMLTLKFVSTALTCKNRVTIIIRLMRVIFPYGRRLDAAMKLDATQREFARRFIAVSVFVSLAMISATSIVQASCGDYLLHGNETVSRGDQQVNSLGWSYFQPQSQSQAPIGNAACENGKCQSAPMSAPTDPPRSLVPRQSALAGSLADSSHSDNPSWTHPTDGLSPLYPFLEIPSPPPKHS